VQSAIQLAERAEPGAVVLSQPGSAVDSGYYYPTEVEAELIRCARAGDVDSVRAIAAEVTSENFENRRLSRESVRGLYRELEATRSKLVRLQVTNGTNIGDRSADLDLEHRVRFLLDSLVQLAEHNRQAGTSDSPLKEPIATFVRENALNADMGLKLLAMQFNLSEVYVSKLFRELFGENFHSFVERIRMEHATQLLRTSRLNIEQIAERVGYQSANTFRRVFKRTYGISPSSYDRSGVPPA
jgi:AraC-like DNA-binding protein